MNSLRVEAHTCLHTRAGLHSQHPQKTRPGLTGIVSRCVSDCCSVTHSCLTLCDPKDCSTPGLPVHHQLSELAQTLFHWVGDAIQPSHPLSPPSPPAFNLSSIRVFSNESVLHITWPKYWSFSYSIRTSSEYSGLISLQSKGHSRVFSSTTAQKHQFFSAQPSLWSNSHIHTWLIEKIKVLIIRKFVGKLMSLLFDTLSTFVIPFHPRSKYLLISWL